MMYHRKGRHHDPGGLGPSVIVFVLTILITLTLVLFSHCVKAQTLEITGQQTITDRVFHAGSDYDHPCILVTPGATLTIKGCDLTTQGYAIIVSQGATLVMDSCRATYYGVSAYPQVDNTALVLVAPWAASVQITHCKFSGPVGRGVSITGTVTGYLAIGENVFRDCFCAVQFTEAHNLPNAWVVWNIVAESDNSNYHHGDRFSTYDSSGIPGNPIRYYHNLIVGSIHSAWTPWESNDSGLNAGDANPNPSSGGWSGYVDAAYNTVLNLPLGSFYSNNNTTTLTGNIMIGISDKRTFLSGIACVQPQSGIESQNFAAAWNWPENRLNNYYPQVQPGNYDGTAADITLANEQLQVAIWIDQLIAAGQYVGPADDYDGIWVNYPQAADFSGVGQ